MAHQPARGRRSGGLALVLLLALVGLATFSRGFFPVKPLLPGVSPPQSYSVAQSEGDSAASAPFSRLAFVVVDALRSDFLIGPDSHFSFARSFISEGKALPYTAIAQAPTVTLPRLKALTTGSNPTFLDAILNIADESTSSATFEHVDSWLYQLVHRDEKEKAKLVFAGDDTWLRLFPQSWFAWSEGVSSFFVSDTVTVDTNVTRHLDALLSSASADSLPPPADWDALILHYLGLDHIGHLGGPESPLMPQKQAEMDDVIQRLYSHLAERDQADGKRSLLVVVGDHGMTEGGNHGGSTEAETSAALLIAAPSLPSGSPASCPGHASPYKHCEVVQQIDLVPTLSALFNLGIPKNSMGRLIESAMRKLRPASLRSALVANAQQVAALLEASGSGVTRALYAQAAEEEAASAGGDIDAAEQSEEALLRFLTLAQARLLSASGSYHPLPLRLGLVLLSSAALLALYILRPCWRFERTGIKLLVGGAVVVYLGSFFASSFIEEEHEGWYFGLATALLLLAFRPTMAFLDRFLLVASAASIRAMRAWAHNGQKNIPNTSLSLAISSSPDLSYTLLLCTYLFFFLSILYTLARAARAFSRSSSTPRQLLTQALAFAVLATVAGGQALVGVALHLVVDLGQTSETSTLLRLLGALDVGGATELARVGYGLAAVAWTTCFVLRRRTPDVEIKTRFASLALQHLALAFLAITRTANAPLLVFGWLQHLTLHRLARSGKPSPLGIAALVAAFQACGFFGLGGSNSLASVDLSQAYTGLTSYSLPLVTLLTYLSNFSLPLLHSLSLAALLAPAPPASRRLIYTYLTAFHVLALGVLCASAAHFTIEGHLFVLTVFSPAVLVKAVTFVFLHVATNLGLARVLVG
ncbi:hypothetical protein JCM10207_008493 [Rhodosporidiobolus poonsookiae]